jgi:hypothetical protein
MKDVDELPLILRLRNPTIFAEPIQWHMFIKEDQKKA